MFGSARLAVQLKFGKLHPISFRGRAEISFKSTVKVRNVIISHTDSNIHNRIISFCQLFGSSVQPDMINIFVAGNADVFFKRIHKMA